MTDSHGTDGNAGNIGKMLLVEVMDGYRCGDVDFLGSGCHRIDRDAVTLGERYRTGGMVAMFVGHDNPDEMFGECAKARTAR